MELPVAILGPNGTEVSLIQIDHVVTLDGLARVAIVLEVADVAEFREMYATFDAALRRWSEEQKARPGAQPPLPREPAEQILSGLTVAMLDGQTLAPPVSRSFGGYGSERQGRYEFRRDGDATQPFEFTVTGRDRYRAVRGVDTWDVAPGGSSL